jgi:hypothetical protein
VLGEVAEVLRADADMDKILGRLCGIGDDDSEDGWHDPAAIFQRLVIF